jgi:hypothetical protein
VQGSEIKGKKREELHDKIKQLNLLNKHFILKPRDISILQENNNAVIIFDQIFSVSNNNSFQGFYNKLNLEKINNKWYIVDEGTATQVTDKNLALVNNSQQRETSPATQKEIRNLITKWLTSWKSGDMKTYRSCYASNFQSKEMDLDAWISHKSDARQNSNNINISIHNLQISADRNIARAVFTQRYSSSKLNSKGRKTLELRKKDDD